MRETSVLIFEILEKAWATRDCALIDMKIEFGIDEKGMSGKKIHFKSSLSKYLLFFS